LQARVPPIPSMPAVSGASSARSSAGAEQLEDTVSFTLPSPVGPPVQLRSEQQEEPLTQCGGEVGGLPMRPRPRPASPPRLDNALGVPEQRERMEEFLQVQAREIGSTSIGQPADANALVAAEADASNTAAVSTATSTCADGCDVSSGSGDSPPSTGRTQASVAGQSATSTSQSQRRPLQTKQVSELSGLAQEAAAVSALAKVRAQAALAELGLNCETVSGRSTPLITPRPFSARSPRGPDGITPRPYSARGSEFRHRSPRPTMDACNGIAVRTVDAFAQTILEAANVHGAAAACTTEN
jgi:hypothetical protein